MATGFAARVLAAVRRVPPGRVATYGDIARLAGRPRAWRAVGTLMRTCADPRIPCHRIVAAGGRLGGYGKAWPWYSWHRRPAPPAAVPCP